MLNYILFATRRVVVSGLLSTASAYGAISQSEQAVLSYTPKYSELKIPYDVKAESPAKANCKFFADNHVFKARGSLDAQISEAINLNVAATVQIQNGKERIIPEVSTQLRLSPTTTASFAYDGNNRMAKLGAKIYF